MSKFSHFFFCMVGWLTRGTDPTKGEAYCKICRVHLRAHKTDLGKHAASKTHTAIANSLDRKSQPKIGRLCFNF